MRCWVWLSKKCSADGQAKQTVEKVVAECTPAGLEHRVLHCRLADTHESTTKRLEMHLVHELDDLQKVMFELFEKEGCRRTEGRAPRSNNERQIMDLLQKMGEWNSSTR